MLDWWNAMGGFEQILATIGIASALLLVVQIIIALIGAAANGGADADVDAGGEIDFDLDGDVSGADAGFDGDFSGADAGFDGDFSGADSGFDADSASSSHTDFSSPEGSTGLRLFTMQGIIAFLAVFSWSALLIEKSGVHMAASVLLGVVLGFIAMLLMALAMRAMLKLQYDGTSDIRNALGSVGTVYLTIPPERDHTGKVTIMLQGSLREIDALTDDKEPIPTGAQVQVSGVSGKNILLVKRK